MMIAGGDVIQKGNSRKSEQPDSTVTDFILRINPVESISELTNVVLSFFLEKTYFS